MTITLTREEAQQVLDAMIPYQQKVIATTKEYGVTVSVNNEIETAIETLRARLSAPEPEPVAGYRWEKGRTPPSVTFTAPPQPEPPCKTGSQCIGGKCPQCVVPEPEPVAWMNESDMGRTDWKVWAHGKPTATMPLYTAQPQREWQGLTDEEILEEYRQSYGDDGNLTDVYFARAIEAKLKEKNGG